MIHSFDNDYAEGAHPRILAALQETNLEQTPGYTFDAHSEHARKLIRAQAACPDARVEFVVGGTQANSLVVAAALRPHEAVIAAQTGHVAVHETGSIEATGHKVVTAYSEDGVLTAEAAQAAFSANTTCHMVKPRLLYISDSTETGTIYTKADLVALRMFADEHDLLLFLDGARMAVALTAPGNDLELRDIARLCDVFTIGGTKNGMLFGECIVITNPALQGDFNYLMKQRGALLAKGRLLGIQYETIFTGDLYWDLGSHANAMAARLREGLVARGVRLYGNSPTNQQFIVATPELAQQLEEEFYSERFATAEDGSPVMRLVTSWATQPEAVDELLAWLDER